MELRDIQPDPVLVEGQRRGLHRAKGTVFGPLEVIRQVEVGQRDPRPSDGAVDPRVESQPTREAY